MLQRVLAHVAGNSLAGRSCARHVATVAHMPSSAGLVRSHVIGAEDHALLLGNERLLIGSHPVGHCLGFAHVFVERVCRTLTDHRDYDGSNRPGVAVLGPPDVQHLKILSRKPAIGARGSL